MINVKIKGVADIGKLMSSGGSEQEIAIPGDSTLRDLLDLLVDKFGEDFGKRIYREGSKEPGKDLRLLLNGRDIAFTGGLEMKLQDGDRLSLLPIMAGG